MNHPYMSLKEYLVINPISIQETGDFKKQWPPVGKSSDTPKEVKNARREEVPPVLGKPADMGRDVFICTVLSLNT